MDQTLYHYSLCIALPLMLFFGFHLLLASVPEQKRSSGFLLSRRLMGTALLILAANYSIHFFFSIRLTDKNDAIIINMVTYFLCYWLFTSAMMALLDRKYLSRRRFACHIALWITYSALACGGSFLPDRVRTWALVVLALLLLTYGILLSLRLLRTYYRSVRMFRNTHSDDIGQYIRWLSVFTYWAIIFGVSCAVLTFLPDRYVFIWVLSAVPFYIYLYCCYQNYAFFYDKVDEAFQEDTGIITDNEDPTVRECRNDVPEYHSDIAPRLDAWVAEEAYLTPGITLNDLSSRICTNRTYLSEYINSVYHKPFRDWITDLRIEYAKRLMKEEPQLQIQEVSLMSGFLSLSHFSRTFSAKEGCSPARWRRANL